MKWGLYISRRVHVGESFTIYTLLQSNTPRGPDSGSLAAALSKFQEQYPVIGQEEIVSRQGKQYTVNIYRREW